MFEPRPYQSVGIRWLTSDAKRLVLGDDPGLGKTPQAIRAWEGVAAQRIIVICPGILRSQWVSEIAKFSTQPRAVQVITEGRFDLRADAEVLVVSYDLISRPAVLTKLSDWRADVLVCDEAHFLRNLKSKRSVAVFGKSGSGLGGLGETAKRVWFLSGTLAPNSVLDYFPYLRFSGQFTGSYDAFRRRYTNGYEGEYGYVVTRQKDIFDLKRRLAKIMLRRTRRQVLHDLPPVSVVNLVVDPVESPAGDEFILHQLPMIDRELSDEVALFQKFGRFRQPANVAAMRRQLSMTKVLPLCQIIDEELQADPSTKVVIFGIHAVGLKFLRAFLAPRYNAKLLFGGTLPNKREIYVNEFQTSPRVRVLVCQNSVAGLGLNLTAANSVYIFEASWLPDDNEQLIARTVRIGQGRPVVARYVSVANTIDERVNQSLVRRSRLAAEFRS